MRKKISVVCVVLLAGLLSGCGSTSVLRSPSGGKFVSDVRFDCVRVDRFENKISKADAPDSKIEWACDHFANLIAQEITKTGAFKTVSRAADMNEPKEPNEPTLCIGGDITRYEEGSAFTRFMIGLGAGSSYFDAVVKLWSDIDQKEIGVIKVDRNSWVLGGGIASGQTPETYMKEASKKIAKEMKKLAKSEKPTQ